MYKRLTSQPGGPNTGPDFVRPIVLTELKPYRRWTVNIATSMDSDEWDAYDRNERPREVARQLEKGDHPSRELRKRDPDLLKQLFEPLRSLASLGPPVGHEAVPDDEAKRYLPNHLLLRLAHSLHESAVGIGGAACLRLEEEFLGVRRRLLGLHGHDLLAVHLPGLLDRELSGHDVIGQVEREEIGALAPADAGRRILIFMQCSSN